MMIAAVRTVLFRRSSQIALLLALLCSVACTQIPLLNYLGFEFSSFISVILFFLAGHWLIASKDRYSVSPWQLAVFAKMLIMLPFIVLALNGVFVKNCSWMNGILFYLINVLPVLAFSVSLAHLLLALPLKRKHIWFFLIGASILLHVAIVTFVQPQIFAFNPILGYFPGFTYDETLNILPRLALYRGTTILLSATLLFLSFSLTAIGTKRIRYALFAAIGTLGLAIVYVRSDQIGFSSSENSIASELGGSITTAHFRIYYPASLISEAKAQRLADLHEFYYYELCEKLQLEHQPGLKSFIYSNAEQKGRLIGAGATLISKPWLGQTHINMSDVDAVLKHEMVHLLAAEFGMPILGISWSSGIVEGLAVAIEGESLDEPLPKASALVFASGVKIDPAGLFSLTGFFHAPSSVSYTLAGSFVQQCLNTSGIGAVKDWYRTGDFANVDEDGIERAMLRWEEEVREIPLTGQDSMKAEYFFRRRSIFGKECARTIANLNAETRQTRELPQALATAERSLSLSPSTDAMMQKTAILVRMKRYKEAIAFGDSISKDPKYSLSVLPMLLSRGDAYWGIDSLADAEAMYRTLYDIHLSLAWDEVCALRIAGLRSSRSLPALKQLFLNQIPDSLRIDSIASVAQRASLPDEQQLLRFLLVRELLMRDSVEQAFSQLQSSTMPADSTLHLIGLRRLGRVGFLMGSYERAKSALWEAKNYTRSETVLADIDEWIRRCEWEESVSLQSSTRQ